MNDATNATESVEFDIYAENLPKLEAKVEEMNRRIARLIKKGYTALSLLTLTKGESRVVTACREFVAEVEGPYGTHKELRKGLPEQLVKTKVVLSGAPSVVVNGWRFVAVIQHEEGGLVAAVPGNEGLDLSAYRAARATCDHCSTSRNRKDTYLVRNEATGALKQVGSSCLKDFLGQDPFLAAMMAEHLAIIDNLCAEWDGEFERVGQRTVFPAAEFLAITAAVIRNNGWLSRGAAREKGCEGSATADLAMAAITAKPSEKEYLKPSAEDIAYAQKVLAWAQERFEGAR
jgi:hypothetical protein